MGDHWKPVFAIVLCCLGIAGMFSGRPIARAPGVLAEDEPHQTATTASSFAFNEFELTPQADYDITARVLSVEPYHFDGGSDLSPLDFAVGWGVMSDSAVLAHFRVTQGGRFFTIYPDDEAIDIDTALRGSANMHLIPATSTIRRQLGKVKPGNIVHLQGRLVNASRADGFTWNTSLTREDTGNGACELFYVESVQMR